jgi:2-amino-4-hydroxy-6-hydroxymethyldihydropteridine diphosphokinase
VLVEQLHDVEACQGRQRAKDNLTSRLIDIDLLLYGDSVLYDQGMDVPRREILKYAHVLKPLSLVLPDACHPVSGCSYHELWGAMSVCQDQLLELADLEL